MISLEITISRVILDNLFFSFLFFNIQYVQKRLSLLQENARPKLIFPRKVIQLCNLLTPDQTAPMCGILLL